MCGAWTTVCPGRWIVHSEGCYQLELASPQPELVCGAGSGGETLIHTHDSFCYDERGELICGREEGGEHTHEESCFTVVVRRRLKCGLEECAPEVDEEGNVLQEGHAHTAACWMTDEELRICGQEEGQGHTHGDGCWDWAQRQVCAEEEREPGHIHGDECYESAQVLACQRQELIPHAHGEGCYDGAGTPVCGLPETGEHQHSQPYHPPYKGQPPAALITVHLPPHPEGAGYNAHGNEPYWVYLYVKGRQKAPPAPYSPQQDNQPVE